MIIRTNKSYAENIIFLLFISFFIVMIYFGTKTWIHYLAGILAIILLISMWFKTGITTEGFLSMRRGQGIIKWNKINKLTVLITKNIKITIIGNSLEEVFYFKREDYNKILHIMKENLPIKAELNIT